MSIQFTDDEIETIKSLILEWGSDCPDTDCEKVQELKYKLDLEKRPTPEEIAERERRYEEIRNSPFAKQMREILNASNHLLDNLLDNLYKSHVDVLYGKKDFKIGSTLRIRMPVDYQAKKE